ncbi:conserved hypothetical protein [Streptomyces harbinensis]|uniref:Calcium/calmodulin-dependent protein kinase II association-domain domain-containing protein n=2 Tax=Streptomyces harbinensis TaxID=1176198 RepID=A0A1I6SZ98_9ACTN|nr:conserved hypothetical protein [Streptomyces harbinensis]
MGFMRKNTVRNRASWAVAASSLLLLTAASGATAVASADTDAETFGHGHGHHHPHTPYPTQAEIRAQFDTWNDALATLDPEAVADLYAPDGVLLPTLSNQIRSDRDGIVDYFEHFLAKYPVGEINESYVDILSPTSAVDSGSYTFTLTEDGVTSTVDARYTFVYEKDQATGDWLIVSHHSSANPEG